MLDEKTIATLKREKATLEEIMKNGRQQIKALDSVLKAYGEDKPTSNGRTPRRRTTPVQATTATGNSLRDSVREVLGVSQPLAVAQIRAALNARKVDFTDSNLSYTLSQSHLFENANGKWSLTEFDDE